MAKLSRRKLLKQTGVGVAAVGVLAGAAIAVPHLVAKATSADAAGQLTTTTSPGLMVAYVRDLSKGEIGILVGEREIIHRDPNLVVSLLNATK